MTAVTQIPNHLHPAYRLILPYLRPIEKFILDPDISEIMLNSPTEIFIEKDGVIEKVQGVTIPNDQLRVAVQNIARSLGDDWEHPTRRVVADVHEMGGIKDGLVMLRELHRWDEMRDRFEVVAEPARF